MQFALQHAKTTPIAIRINIAKVANVKQVNDFCTITDIDNDGK